MQAIEVSEEIEIPEGVEVTVENKRVTAVSYTHLTLPTILLV